MMKQILFFFVIKKSSFLFPFPILPRWYISVCANLDIAPKMGPGWSSSSFLSSRKHRQVCMWLFWDIFCGNTGKGTGGDGGGFILPRRPYTWDSEREGGHSLIQADEKYPGQSFPLRSFPNRQEEWPGGLQWDEPKGITAGDSVISAP